MSSAAAGSIAFPLAVACHYAAGRRGKRGIEYQPFAVLGRPDRLPPVHRLAPEYRCRFGIETSYRQLHQVRAPTTSRDPALRLLLVTVALLLVNMWVWLKAHLLTHTPPRHRPAARRWLARAFPLDRWRDLLAEVMRATYSTATTLCYPFPLPSPPEL